MPSFPTSFHGWQTELLYAVPEATLGTALTTGLIREECRSLTMTDEFISVEEEKGYIGLAADVYEETLYQRQSSTAIQLPFRNSGAGARGILTICGAGTEVRSGAGPNYTYTGTPSPTTCREDTWTIYQNTGDAVNVKQAAYSTLTSIALSSGPSASLLSDLSFMGRFPALTARSGLTLATYLGTTANYPTTRQSGNNLVATLYNSAGTAFTATVTNFNLKLERPVSHVVNMGGLDPVDWEPGILAMSGSFDFRYDGAGAGTIYNDFRNYTELGDSTHKWQVVWTDANADTLTIKFYRVYLSNCQMPPGSDTYITGTVDFKAVNDLRDLNSATPKLSVLDSVALTNSTGLTLMS